MFKQGRACYAITYVKQFMSQGTLKAIYFLYFHSILLYGIIFWDNSAYSSDIFKIQKRIIRIIMNPRNRDFCRQLFKNLKILPLKSQYIFSLLLFTSRGTRHCPGWPMAKPDSNFVYYITKKGRRNKLWKSIRVTYARCYVRKGPVLMQKHTRARTRRQHCEWIHLLRQLIGKQRHVTKLECYRLFEMLLKFFVFPSGAGM